MFILFNNPVSQKHAQIKFHPQNLKGKNYKKKRKWGIFYEYLFFFIYCDIIFRTNFNCRNEMNLMHPNVSWHYTFNIWILISIILSDDQLNYHYCNTVIQYFNIVLKLSKIYTII